MVATYPFTKYAPIGDIHGVRRETTCSCIAAEEPSLTVGLAARCYPKARALRSRERSGHEEIPRRHGSDD
jgi:hypothetical protein